MKKNKKEGGDTLRDLLIIKLQALYDMEQYIVKSLPKMITKATDEELKEALSEHLNETENHILRLEQVFELLAEKPNTLKSDGIRGIVKDGEWNMKHTIGTTALDAVIIASASYVEHHEIAGYLSAINWAEELEEEGVTDLLEETLGEEENAEEILRDLATERINAQANMDEVEEEIEVDEMVVEEEEEE